MYVFCVNVYKQKNALEALAPRNGKQFPIDVGFRGI